MFTPGNAGAKEDAKTFMKNSHLPWRVEREGFSSGPNLKMNMWSRSVIMVQKKEVFDERLKTNNRKDVHHHWSLEKCKIRPK